MHAAPSSPRKSITPVAFSCAVAGALGWSASHLAIHQPRGWPFPVLGEWDLLLVASAVAAGEAPPAVIGAVQGGDVGSYLVALIAAIPVALGVAPQLAGKLVAMGFGAACAGVAAAWASVLAAHDFEVEPGSSDARSGAWTAGVLTTLLFAFAWPGLHFELAGISGRTPEALLPQLVALLLILDLRRGGGPTAGLAAGFCAGVAVLLSPVALWTLGCVGAVSLIPRRRAGPYPRWLRPLFPAAVVAGAALGIGTAALLLPDGIAGLQEFARSTSGDLLASTRGGGEVSTAAADGPGPLGVLGLLSGALEGGAHNPLLAWRGLLLLCVGWLLVLAAAGRVALGRMFRELDDAAILGVVALSWIVPLSILPLDWWAYPLAYRYWLLPLALGGILFGAEIGRWVGTRKIGTLAVFGAWIVGLFLLTPLHGIDRSIVAPPPTRAEALVAAGAHRMAQRPGHGRHDAFLALSPHVSPDDRVPLLEGYAMALGGDAAVDARDGLPPLPEWEAVGRRGSSRERAAMLIGAGCGATVLPKVPPTLLASWVSAVADQEYLLYGVGLCTADPGRAPGPDLAPAIDAEPALSPRGWRALGEGLRDGGMPREKLATLAPDAQILDRMQGGWDAPERDPKDRSTVARPASLMPPRW